MTPTTKEGGAAPWVAIEKDTEKSQSQLPTRQ